MVYLRVYRRVGATSAPRHIQYNSRLFAPVLSVSSTGGRSQWRYWDQIEDTFGVEFRRSSRGLCVDSFSSQLPQIRGT